MSPWVGRVRNFVPYPLTFSSPGSGVLECPVVWLLCGSFLKEPRDSGQSPHLGVGSGLKGQGLQSVSDSLWKQETWFRGQALPLLSRVG